MHYVLSGSARTENGDEKSVPRREIKTRQRPGERATDYPGRSHYVMTVQRNTEMFWLSAVCCD